MKRFLISTTTLSMVLTSAAPLPLFAQTLNSEGSVVADDGVILCQGTTEAPCDLDAVLAAISAAAAAEAEAAAAEAAAAEAVAAEAAAADAAAAEAADAAAAEAAAEAAAAAEAEAVAAAQAAAAADAAAAAEADAAASQAQAAADAAAAAAAAAQAAADDADAAAADAAAAAAAAEAAAAEAAAAEAAATEAAAAEAAATEAAAAEAAATEAAAAEAAAAEAAATEAAAAEAAAAEAAATEAEAKAAADAQAAPVEEPAVAGETDPAPEAASEPAQGDAPVIVTETDIVSDEPVSVAAEEAAAGAAPVAAAISATPDEVAADADPAVEEEVVTEATARSSNEDFETTVSGAAAAGARKRSGLSNFEKALLIGLGVVVVGSIISHNRRVELNSGDRLVVLRDDGTYEVLKDDNALLRQPGTTIRTRTYDDGSTLTTITRADGSKVLTVRDGEGRVLRRVHIDRKGRETVLIDDTEAYEPVDVRRLPRQPRYVVEQDTDLQDEAALRAALGREVTLDRRFSLAQVRAIREVRHLAPVVDLRAVTFASGSSVIDPDQARALSTLGTLISDMIYDNRREVFLIEGHTDAVGSHAANLALSDRRAESVALALTEYYGVPPENLVVQGYGEEFLKVDTQGAERANRRASVRRITDLLRSAAAE